MQRFASNFKSSGNRQRRAASSQAGISISKSICEALGGSLDYQVNSDSGSQISFTMKAFLPTRQASDQQGHGQKRSSSTSRTKPKTRAPTSLFPVQLITVDEGDEDQMEEKESEMVESCESSPQHQESYDDFTIIESEEIDVDLEGNLGLGL